MHLMIVSTDLHHFAHVHPVADGDGFRLEHTFEEGGEYLLVVDYQQPGRGQIVDRHRVHVEGAVKRPAEVLAKSPLRQRVDGLELALKIEGELHAGEGAMLHFDATDAETGLPVADLELYLGAKAHFMVLSADGEDFVHVHALEDAQTASRVSAHAVFPRPGLYKLWAQMQRRGAVVTVPFVLRVGTARPGANHHSGGHAHHKH
ncbi:secreted protein [Labilithrix luteola]|uniref:Secreted protein n=2 Tax=Labilithrix luteola TaxID=1391654 RepID=A0A0K1PYZ4_9BACT|nr:secreted protein [Labilithrix luteola]